MKRKIALLVSIIMMIGIMLPVNIFAAEDAGLEKAIKLAKSKFSIPDSYSQFNYYLNMEGDRKIWSLDWSSKSPKEGTISVAVDDMSNIIRYYKYGADDYNPYQQGKLPKVSKQEAKEKAQKFIKDISTSLLYELKYVDNAQNYINDYAYVFNYIRVVNRVPFPNNSVSVEVNRNTGEVRSFNKNWTDGLQFPKVKNVISIEDAMKAYKEKLGLSLEYRYTMEGEKSDEIKTFLVYAPKFTNSYIDAVTGEKVDLGFGVYGFGRGEGGGIAFDEMAVTASSGNKAQSVNLSEEELKAIKEVAKIMTKDEAEKKAREFKKLELTDEFKLSSAYIGKDWMSKNNYNWDLNFVKEPKNPKDENDPYININVRINAITGDIVNFNRYWPSKSEDDAKFDKEASKAAVEAFLKDIQPDKFKEAVYDENYREYYGPLAATEEKPRDYAFRYIRTVNDATFPSNYLSVRFDAVTGKISNFDSVWFDAKFDPTDKALSKDVIYEKLFSEIGLELQYLMEYPNEYYIKYAAGEADVKKPAVKLVYGFKQTNKPAMFDANTGVVLNYNGQPYKENKKVEYTDIAGIPAEGKIKVLAEFGVYLEGTEFKPTANILQKEFITLLAKISGYYGDPNVPADKQEEQIYNFMVTQGVVKENEKAPGSAVTREDAVKFIIRALKYDKVAEIKGIYNLDFKDRDKINPDLTGHVAIAKGLNIISGHNGNFNPKANLKRVDAIVMIYNYLQR